jgi:intraflagellar transport protein 122
VDNSFPISLYKSSASIRCCDLNITKKKLALVDTNNNLIVIDLISQAHLYQEMGTQSCVWNSDLEDVLAYSGNGILSIRTGNMPALTQKSDAIVQGFKGFQLFVIKEGQISLMDVSQSSTLVKFIEKKDFKMAYKLACLGVTDNDTRMLGIEALQNNDF